MKKLLLKSSKILLVINIIFWAFTAIYFSFLKFTGNNNYLIIKILLFFEPLLFAVTLYGITKKIKIIYFFSIIFVFFNAILSITDEIGFYDIISLILNVLLLINLLFIWKYITLKK